MAKLTIQVRTHDNLLELLANGECPAWVVAQEREAQITHVQVVSFDGKQMIEGVYDRTGSKRREDGRLILRFLDGRIVNSTVEFESQNPVRFIDG